MPGVDRPVAALAAGVNLTTRRGAVVRFAVGGKVAASTMIDAATPAQKICRTPP
jgi:hypothetical protein